jgi:hypothetical protein
MTNRLVVADKGFTCIATRCRSRSRRIKRGTIAVAHRVKNGCVHYYHPECFTYASGEPVFKVNNYVIVKRGVLYGGLLMVVRRDQIDEKDIRLEMSEQT